MMNFGESRIPAGFVLFLMLTFTLVLFYTHEHGGQDFSKSALKAVLNPDIVKQQYATLKSGRFGPFKDLGVRSLKDFQAAAKAIRDN